MKRIAIVVTLLTLGACAQLGLQPAQTFDQKLAYAYGVHTAVLQAAAASTQSGMLPKPDGAKVLALADQSRALLDDARALEATDVATAGNKLALATTVLVQVQDFLNKEKVKK